VARKTNVRTVLNRQALDVMRAGWVDGFEDLALFTLGITQPPDAEPRGEGLVNRGDLGVWAQGKKVAGTARKPRALMVKKYEVVMALGFGFPGRFQETGTIRQPARPFLTPPWQAMTQRMANSLGATVVARLRRLK
jgi:hypothetical protein